MSIGHGVSAASLGAPPANIVVQPHVAQLDVLARAAVFVTHGGMNSVSESLYHRVPMIVVPQMSEQQMVGKQVAALGAGLYIAPADVTADRLRVAVRQIRGDVRFREQADKVRQSFDAAGGVRRGADAIVAFTRRRHAARKGVA
jgi:MGT family glycosyltransferase